MVKTHTDCSCRGPRFTHADHVTATITPASRDLMAPSGLPGHPTQVAYTYIDRCTSVKNKNKSFFLTNHRMLLIGLL